MWDKSHVVAVHLEGDNNESCGAGNSSDSGEEPDNRNGGETSVLSSIRGIAPLNTDVVTNSDEDYYCVALVRIRFEIQESANFQFQYCCAGYGIR
jgi:hypothetical protein